MDLSAPGGAMDHRSWRWFKLRLAGLLSADTRIGRLLTPEPDATPTRPSTYD